MTDYIVACIGYCESCWETDCKYHTTAKKPRSKPVSAGNGKTDKKPSVIATPQRGATCAVDLLGNPFIAPVIPSRQLTMFDASDYVRVHWGIPTVVCRENGETASGGISATNRQREYTFVERETGKTYYIPVRCCRLSWTGDTVVISIDDDELMRRTSLWGMFASCCLF